MFIWSKLTWKDFIKVHNNVRIPAPLLSNFTRRSARNRRKKLNLIVLSFYKNKNAVKLSRDSSALINIIIQQNTVLFLALFDLYDGVFRRHLDTDSNDKEPAEMWRMRTATYQRLNKISLGKWSIQVEGLNFSYECFFKKRPSQLFFHWLIYMQNMMTKL